MAVRLVSPFLLPGLRKEKPSYWFSCCGRDRSPDREVQHCEKVIIHAHGGGFIAMTSRPHQNYIRKWAKQTNTPILCVDYRLAPKDPFPAALDDVWQTYIWVLRHGEKELGINPKKIVLAGDSAGGNLVLGCALKAIEAGVRLPDGLLLAYPALNLWREAFTPSFLLSLEDMVMHHTFMRLCHKCYVQDEEMDTKRNQYLSPLYADAALLARLPPTRILVGSKDPLHDDCWRLVERLDQTGVDVHMTVYSGLVHGGMNFAIKNGMQDGIRMVDQGALYLVSLLG